MEWKSPQGWPLRPEGGAVDVHVAQYPVSANQLLDLTYWDLTAGDPVPAANQIVAQNINGIEHFIRSNRATYSLGVIPVLNNLRQLAGMTVQYINQFGREQIVYIVQPVSALTVTASTAAFVAIDQGNFARSSANTLPSFADFDPGTNYPGGYNVWSSSDGINWTHQKQGVIDTNPSSFMSTNTTSAGYSWSGEITIYLTAGSTILFQTSYTGVLSQEGGGVPLPADILPDFPSATNGAGTIALPSVFNSPAMVYPFWIDNIPSGYIGGIPDQPTAFLTNYGFFTGSTTLAPFASWGETNSITQEFTTWNLSGPISALDGVSGFITSSSHPVQLFVIGGNGSNGVSGMTVPFYYRSKDGANWTQFVPPINPTDPWLTSPSDCFFDDGSQRTTSTDGSGNLSFDGAPTLLWYSFASYTDPLYESSDTKTWVVSSRKAGNNPVSNKTDDVYVGDPDNNPFYGQMGTTASDFGSLSSSSSTDEWTRVFGKIADGRVMGVQVQAFNTINGAQEGYIYAGLATDDPSTWTAIKLPIPANAELVAQKGAALDLENYNISIAGYTEQLEIAQNQLAAVQAAAAWGVANSYTFIDELNYMVTEMASLVASIEAVIAGLSGPPGPRTALPAPSYVAYATPAGSNEGIFVCVGGLQTQDSIPGVGALHSSNAPLFWYSRDAMTWFVANYDPTYSSDEFAVSPIEFLVSGNPADQIFATAPAA